MTAMLSTQNDQLQWNNKMEEEIRLRRQKEIIKFQRESFPIDPILLYELTVTSVDGRQDIFYALPNDDLVNPEIAQKLVFFDIIQGDGIHELSFVNCSILIRKVVYSNIDEIRSTTLMVHDAEMNALRASRVLLGLLGIANK